MKPPSIMKATATISGTPMKSETKLEANTIEIHSQAKTSRGEYLATEMWKLSSDGNTMVIQIHSDMAGRGNDSSAVYERAQGGPS